MMVGSEQATAATGQQRPWLLGRGPGGRARPGPALAQTAQWLYRCRARQTAGADVTVIAWQPESQSAG